MLELDRPITRPELAGLLGITTRRVYQLIDEGVIDADGTGQEQVHQYLGRLRERAAPSPIDVERARLARAQREKIEMELDARHEDLIPAGELRDAMRSVARQSAAILDAIPADCKRACPSLAAGDVGIIKRETQKVAQVMQAIESIGCKHTDGKKS